MSTPSESAKRDQTEKLLSVITAVLAGDTYTEEHLNEQLRLYRPLAAPDLDDGDLEQLARRLTARLSIEVKRGVGVTSKEYRPWLEDKKRDIVWNHWLAYKQWLLLNNRAPGVVDRMDELTDTILDYVGDPTVKETPWQRRGLVLGDVQSGKTAAYLGLFNKAVDAGYRLVIVLAGHTESLRRQTQERVDEGVIGRDSVRSARRSTGTSQVPPRYIGVGALRRDLAAAVGMTTVISDFSLKSREATSQELGADPAEPYFFVVKKNKSILAGLKEWLGDQRIKDNRLTVPLFLLDDESDYASINTRGENDPTAINNEIRGILDLFEHASYLGFTATPFANIFIDHSVQDDLFPRDYIYSLESPSNYVGAERVFGVNPANERMITYLEDAHPVWPLKHRSGLIVETLPDSLLEAIRTFFLANAVRDLRGQGGEPRSMLINVSRFTRVQAQVHDLVREELEGLRNAVQLHAGAYRTGTPNPEIRALEHTYEEQYAGPGTPTWSEVLGALPAAVADLRTRLVNSTVDKKLADEELASKIPARQIAVGGDVLSRGLTLDGLTVSYFYRHSAASDTLMQMARFFGYRDGYEDLCRLWIAEDVAASFAFIADSVQDLRRELKYMHDQRLTPKHFGLAVKKHPGALLVTAKNKMRSAQVSTARISLRNRSLETPKLPSDPTLIEANMEAATQLVERITKKDGIEVSTIGHNHGWRDVPRATIADFLQRFRAHESNALFAPQLAQFIASTKAADLQEWDVVVMGGRGADTPIGGLTVKAPRRSATIGPDSSVRVSGKSMRVAGREDIAEFLTAEQKQQARDEWVEEYPGKDPSEEAFRPYLVRPALILYPVETDFSAFVAGNGDNAGGKAARRLEDQRVLAVKLAFPPDPNAVPTDDDDGDGDGDVEYVINTVAQESWFVEFSGGSEADADIDE